MELPEHDLYREVFSDYPDVLDAEQISKMLSVSTKMIYKLIKEGTISAIKVGRTFRIPKVSVMRYMNIFPSYPNDES